MFKYSSGGKRYHTLDYSLKSKFGCKTVKIPLNGGFTCPNIDGTKGVGGCIYCSTLQSDYLPRSASSIDAQFEEYKKRISSKWSDCKYIAYFHANTNTYAPLSQLKSLFSAALSLDNVVGLSIATRADCISEETIEYLSQLSGKTYLTVELGLQTTFDETAKFINRCHSFDDFLDCYQRLKQNHIRSCIHLINGLPNESPEMMLQTAKIVGKLSPEAIKIHSLHILKDTALAELYLKGELEPLSKEEYVDIVCRQLKYIPQDTVIERITGDGDRRHLLAPNWSADKRSVIAAIDKQLAAENTWQGKMLYNE